MSSLRGRLLKVTWTAVLLVGAVSAVVTFLIARHETEILLDGQMQRVALLAASGHPASTGGEAVVVAPPPGYEAEDDLVVAIRDVDGRLRFGSHPQIALPTTCVAGFTDLVVASTAYRAFCLPLPGRTVLVAQSTIVRRESALGAAMGALLPVVLIIPALGLVITWAVRRQLRAVTRAARTLADRPPLSLDPLSSDTLPLEVLPLVEEFNVLLQRVRLAMAREQHFVADAAHALRTPLTALQLQAQVLDGSADAEERARRLQELLAGIRRVVRLSTQLLDLARYDTAANGSPQASDAQQVLEQVAELYSPIAQERAVQLVMAGMPGLRLPGSAPQLMLVLGNLLDNALRFSPAGGCIQVVLTPAAKQVEIQVRDEGPGMPAASLPRAFERFYRVPGDTTPGNGLGLATVSAVVQQLGGTVVLENRTDRSGLVAIVRLINHD